MSSTRAVATPSSVFSYVSQVTKGLPDPIKGCMWFTFGPAVTGCYAPIYSGATELPESYSNTELTQINRDDAFWALNLVDTLPLIKWQNAIQDVRAVYDTAEDTFFAQKPEFESFILDLYSGRRNAAADELASQLATKYTNASMDAVSNGSWGLVDYLLFTYYFRSSSGAPQELPAIDAPPPPTNPGQWKKWYHSDCGHHNCRESYLFDGIKVGKSRWDN